MLDQAGWSWLTQSLSNLKYLWVLYLTVTMHLETSIDITQGDYNFETESSIFSGEGES